MDRLLSKIIFTVGQFAQYPALSETSVHHVWDMRRDWPKFIVNWALIELCNL